MNSIKRLRKKVNVRHPVRKQAKHNQQLFYSRNIPAMIIIALFLIGIVTGSVLANGLDDLRYGELEKFFLGFYENFSVTDINQKTVMIDSLIKYGKYIVIIWIMGFSMPGTLVTGFMFFIKGTAYGFTSAFIISKFGMYGILISFFSYFPQNLVFLPAMFLLGYCSIDFATVKLKNIKDRPQKSIKPIVSKYVVILILGLACVLLTALIETYITPVLVEYISP